MVELSCERGLDARLADIAALPFDDGEFDCVLANRVLYHLPDLDRGLSETERVLRPGGCLVAVAYSDAHLSELYDVVGRAPDPSPFSAENGLAPLRRHFQRVERHDITGTACFESRDRIGALLDAHEEFGYFEGIEIAARLRDLRLPFGATYRHVLFVAHKTPAAADGDQARRARSDGVL